ncbi:MAG TPA: N-acetylmuramoyl-L-alanine amidase [Gaiellaceae bacterium]|nr:N-acetylmuramoyl-L-alanine amidase [Gaiellaceae bacterium]
MKRVLVAAAVALAFPGAAFGAGLVQQRDLRPQASLHVLSPGRFQLVGLHWRGSGRVEYRTRDVLGRWSRWRLSDDEDALPDARSPEARAMHGWRVGEPQWTGPSNAIQYRTVGSVARVRAYFVRTPQLAIGGKRPEIANAPPIITRADWHADEAIRKGTPLYADGIHLAIVHHTAGSNSYTKAQSASIVRAIELYHVQGNGWNDIGYNFLVDKYGQIFEGRYGGITKAVVGAHAMGFNSGSVGVALIGDYGSAAITPAARSALVSLIAWRLDLAHVDPLSRVVRVSAGNPRYAAGTAVTLNAISGHRDVFPTSCPGASLYAQLPSIRTAVAQTGLPKLYAPVVTGALGGPIRFTARLSNSVAWTVTVRDDTGATVASGTGTGTKVDWTWDATAAAPAHYTWAITAPSMRSAIGSVGSAAVPLALSQLKVAPNIVSPNGDGRGDQVQVTYRLTAPATVTAQLQDSTGVPLATVFQGTRPAGKQQLKWSPPASLPDGWYKLALTATAGAKQVSASTWFWIDRTLVATKASPAFSPNGDGVLDKAAIGFTLVNPAHVEVRVQQGATVVASLLTADLPAGPQNLTWDGGGLPDGRYMVVVSTTDSLLTVTQTVPVAIDRKPPTLRLISLRTLVFRASEPGRLVLALNGRWRAVTVRKAGLVHIAARGRVQRVTAYLVDLAGNRSRAVSARR